MSSCSSAVRILRAWSFIWQQLNMNFFPFLLGFRRFEILLYLCFFSHFFLISIRTILCCGLVLRQTSMILIRIRPFQRNCKFSCEKTFKSVQIFHRKTFKLKICVKKFPLLQWKSKFQGEFHSFTGGYKVFTLKTRLKSTIIPVNLKKFYRNPKIQRTLRLFFPFNIFQSPASFEKSKTTTLMTLPPQNSPFYLFPFHIAIPLILLLFITSRYHISFLSTIYQRN